ncbi:ABC transporter ATP-binding protein, partial [Psychrobacter sp. UBA6730]
RVQTLSGGEKQRLAIVRALMQDTKIMMFDEPTNHLDIRHQRFLLNYLHNLVRQQRKSILVVLHDLTHAHRYTDEVVLLSGGQIVAQGTPSEVMTRSQLSDVYDVDIKVHQTEDGLVFI